MSPRALVVDDDRAMVKTLSDVLRMKGWEVDTAYSGDAAVQAATADAFDVVLMDIKMPGMDGVAAFQEMKARRPDVRVVLMTAYAAQDRIGEAEREGVLRVLAKPVDLGQLLGLLADSLRGDRPVLLVDDDPAFLKTLSGVLELHGFETAVAESIEHAVRLMDARRPIAVLLHMHIDAVPTQRAVSLVHEKSPGSALVLYSGQPGGAREVERAVPAGWVYAYLQKPFAVEQVIQVLNGIDGDG